MNKDVTAVISYIPTCDFCSAPAEYDASISGTHTWAYLCKAHFQQHNCKLGLGNGQRLITTIDGLPESKKAKAIKNACKHFKMSTEYIDVYNYCIKTRVLFYGSGEVYDGD